MKKRLKKLLIISGIVLSSLLILLIVSSLVFYYRKSLTKGFLEKLIIDKTGGKVEIGKLDYGLFPFRTQADSVEIFQRIEEMEINISLERLSLKGGIRRLLKKQKPFFQSIEVSGAVLRINIPKVGKKVDIQENILMISQALSYVDQISLENFSLDYVYLGNSISLQKGSLHLSNNKGEWNFSLGSENVEIKNTPKEMALRASFHSRGKLSFDKPLSLEGEFLFGPLSFRQSQKEILLPEIALEFRSEFESDKNTLFFPQFKARIPPILDASASMKLDFKDYSFSFLPEIHLKDLGRTYDLFKPYLESYLSSEIKDLTLSGGAYLQGEIQNIKDSRGNKMNVKGFFQLEPTEIRCSAFGFSLQNSMTGELRAEGSLPDLKFSSRLEFKNGRLSGKNMEVQNFSLELPLKGTLSSLDIPRFRGGLSKFSLSSGGKRIEFNQAEFEGKLNCDLKAKKIDVGRLEFQVASFPPFEMEARINLQPRGGKYLRLRSSEINFASLSTLLSSYLPRKIAEWEPAGLFSLDFEVKNSPDDDGEWIVSAGLDLSQGAFHNPSFTIAAESLHPKIFLNGSYSLSRQTAPFSLTFDLSQGESLWNKYYLSWSKNPFLVKTSGVYHLAQKMLDEFSAEASFSSLGAIKAEGKLEFQEPRLFDLHLSTSPLKLQSLFSFISQQQMQENPSLDIQGEAEGQASLKKEGNKLSLLAQIQLSGGSLGNKDKAFFMEGVKAKIPIHFESGSKDDDKKEEPILEKGYFFAEHLKTYSFSISPFRLDFDVGKNIFIIQPFSAEIFGGKETLGKSVFEFNSEPFSFQGATSLSLSEVDISKFPLKSAQFSLSGKIRANLDQVIINPQEIRTQGEMEAGIFGGRVNVKNLKITQPFSKNRSISCDIFFEDLSLEKFTDSVPFGRVTGIIRGEVKDLAFSYGQPERFSLNLESVKRKGIDQKFSLGAVNDLSVISSGEGSAVPAKSGVTRFISEFGYKKIGIFCSLKNDTFTLRGTVKERGIEYLVKRSWIFGISVVNKKPRNRISFKDMMNRLKRIGQSQKPVTK